SAAAALTPSTKAWRRAHLSRCVTKSDPDSLVWNRRQCASARAWLGCPARLKPTILSNVRIWRYLRAQPWRRKPLLLFRWRLRRFRFETTEERLPSSIGIRRLLL